ncbi:MAG: response regulator [Waterburya sp.]
MIRILLVDDQKAVREYLRAWLEPVANFEIVGTASDGHSAIEQVELLKPDIVLIDMEMPGLNGFEATSIICQKSMGVKVIILSMYDGQEYLARSLQAGATGYLLKNTPKEELIEAISLVNRGYSQFAPGLVNKIVESIPSSATLEAQVNKGNNNNNNADASRLIDLVDSDLSHRYQPRSKPRSKKFYLIIWLVSNLIIWSGSIIYLQFKKPTYTSKWAIALPSSNSSTNIDIPGVGQASSESESPFNSDFSDPRENYKYLASTEEVIENAAKKLDIPLKKFGEPKINTPGNTTLIEFEIEGNKPKIAQSKAIALQESLGVSLKRLRKDESKDRSLELEDTLKAAGKKLETARQKLAQFKIKSGLNSTDQTSNLTYNIEQLRKQRSETIAQKQKTQSRFNELQKSLGLSTQEAADALVLQSDPEFKEYLSNYSLVSRELVNLKAKFSTTHPSIIAKQAEQKETQAELYRRGEFLLGKPVTETNFKNINADSNNSSSQRANLFQELISLQAEETSLIEQAQALNQQILELEVKLTKLAQYGSELQQLEKDVQLAQAVFSSTATKLDLTRAQTSASYPPISVVSSPNLPKKPAAPQPVLVLLGSMMSSLLVTTGLLSLWLKEEHDRRLQSSQFIGSDNSRKNGRKYFYLPPINSEKANSVSQHKD